MPNTDTENLDFDRAIIAIRMLTKRRGRNWGMRRDSWPPDRKSITLHNIFDHYGGYALLPYLSENEEDEFKLPVCDKLGNEIFYPGADDYRVHDWRLVYPDDAVDKEEKTETPIPLTDMNLDAVTGLLKATGSISARIRRTSWVKCKSSISLFNLIREYGGIATVRLATVSDDLIGKKPDLAEGGYWLYWPTEDDLNAKDWVVENS
jgi:hypothetical protein